ncbi:MAG: hypothetical protein AB7U64_08840, partial [Blastocatellales bacterium]
MTAALQSGSADLDTMRASTPQAPNPYLPNGTMPPGGYIDPRPVNSAAFDAYLTALASSGNATGIAGSQPLQAADPASGTASVGGWSHNMTSKNYNFTAPVLSLGGRAGMGVALALSYNSKLWTRVNDTILFNADRGFPAPGWRLGFGEILVKSTASNPYYNSTTGKNSVIYIAPDGTRRDLSVSTDGTTYFSYDSTYLKYESTNRILRFPNGAQVHFAAESGNDSKLLPTLIKDRNGNQIDIYYRTLTNNSVVIDYLIDTAGRRIDFNYQSDRLTSISQNRNGNIFVFAYFDYQAVTIQANFGSLTVDPSPINGTTIYVPSRITYPSGVNYRFSYTSYGQINSIQKWVPTISGQGFERNIANTSFNLPNYDPNNAQNDNPHFTSRTEWAENWQGGNTVGYNYTYNATPNLHYISGANRLFKVSTNNLIHEVSIEANGANGPTKKDRITFISDSGLTYLSNLRPQQIDTFSYDSAGLQISNKKTVIGYIQQDGMWLPATSDEYMSAAVYRRTATTYASYPAQYILGLPQEVSVYAGAGVTLMSRITNSYDETGTYVNSNGQAVPLLVDAPGVIQHDAAYNASFT